MSYLYFKNIAKATMFVTILKKVIFLVTLRWTVDFNEKCDSILAITMLSSGYI